MNRSLALKVIFVILPYIVGAQTGTNDSTKSFSEYLKAEEIKRKNSVQQYAKEHGIPLTGIGEDGTYMFLHHINNGRPVYYKGREKESTGNQSSIHISFLKPGNTSDNKEWTPLVEQSVLVKRSDYHHIMMKSDKPMSAVYIMNNSGKTVYRIKNINTTEVSLPIKNIKEGAYILCVKTGNKVQCNPIQIH